MQIQLITDEILDTEGVNQAQNEEGTNSMAQQQNTIQGCQQFELVTQYQMPEDEKIIYAGFLYDQIPTFILIITASEQEKCSYLSLGKLNPKHAAHSGITFEDSQ